MRINIHENEVSILSTSRSQQPVSDMLIIHRDYCIKYKSGNTNTGYHSQKDQSKTFKIVWKILLK